MLYSEYKLHRRDYQERGHLFLLEMKHACLFYKPGKGKTYPCIDALLDVAKEKPDCNVLILSTANAIKNMWIAEIVPQNILPKNTVLMSFNSAIVESTKIQLLKIKWDVIIIDECHKIKSHNTKSSKLVYQLSKKSKYVWGLSGTPRGNSDIDIFCQFHNMCISDWGTISYSHFVNTCCDVDKKFFGGNVVNVPIGINKRYKGGWERNIAMYTQRVDYCDDDNMPNLDVTVVNVPYKATKEYLQAEDGVVSVGDYETTMTKLAAIQKCHQAANGYLYIPDDEGGRTTYRINRNGKLNWLKDNLTNEPTVIVYRFEADAEDLMCELSDLGYSYTEIVDDFKAGGIDVLLLQCAKCESFNLQMCNKIIFYTLDYSYINYDQMLHRVWRMGQEKDVSIIVLVNDGTIEESIWKSVKNKESFANTFMNIKGGI